ncbi:hypothetical protein Poli38472_012208 [Pythium oligandrum]|uniref:Uncharacterized protein n=1 Tax=Pythium oligandrum TaxID=41045 RepID=A0A8K1CR10_PYTOL|nr:hypothetical protein Poli38472_012208 [Pythium oligandrum]|eukprot:TMW67092.1 hypothetical protein Poli38472_012208 [Pythium oligandrum]
MTTLAPREGLGAATGSRPGASKHDERQQRGYKSTYYDRKREIQRLQQESIALTAHIQRLRVERGENERLRQCLRENALAMAEAQSMVSNHMSSQPIHPLVTSVHLASDPVQRRQSLVILRDQKLHEATEFLLRRTRYLDLRRAHQRVETSEAENGDYCVEQFVATPFKGVTSVQQVYERLLLAMTHQEFSIWEKLGIVANCESDEVDPTVIQNRHFLTIASRVDLEKNTVSFRQYFDRSELLDVPHAVISVNFVDVDELHPYHPATRVRLDVTAAVMVSLCHGTNDTEPMVCVAQWSHARLRQPHCGIDPDVEEGLQDLVSQWGKVISKTIREYLKQDLTQERES